MMATAPNFGAASVPALNPITAQIPNFAVQQMQAQRQQAIAQALMQQGMAPIDYDPHGRISWTQGLAKMLAAYQGTKLGNESINQQAALQQQGMQGMSPHFFGGDQPSPQALGAALSPQASQASQQAPVPQAPQGAPQGQQGGDFVIPGMSPMAAMTAYMQDPAGYMKQLAESRMPTPEQKNWGAQGVDPRLLAGGTIRAGQTNGMTDLQKMQFALTQAAPGSPQAAELQSAIDKANYLAPTVAHQGETLLNPVTQKPYMQIPKAADGISMDWSADPMHPSSGAMPGYSDANAGIQGAQAWRTAGAPVITVKTPDGSEVPMRAGPAAAVGGAQAGVGSGGGGGGVGPAGAGPTAPVPRLGQSTQSQAIQKTGADVLTQAPDQVTKSKQAITGLETALQTLQGVRATGPGTLDSAHVTALLNNFGIPLGKSNTENMQSLQKYLSNSLNVAAQGTGASGSDARFDSFTHGQPNADAMNKVPLEGAIRYVLSQHDASVARGNFIQQAATAAAAKGDPTPAQTAQQQWSQVYNPQVFAFSRMTPTERQAFKAQMPSGQQAKFGAEYNAAHARGWVQ